MKNITIKNTTAADVYVYNFNYGTPASVQPLGSGPLASNQSVTLSLTSSDKMRIYVSEQRLSNSLENNPPCAPNPFNINNDGNVMYSFAEYTYSESAAEYTIDVSYINEYSYPLTLTFSQVPAGVAAEDGFEYGFTSLKTVIAALKAQTDYAWNALVWPAKPATEWGQYPNNMCRVVGPLNAWVQQQATPQSPIGPWEPDSYQAFISSLPYDGTQLFTSSSNLDGWNNDISSPATSGYVTALHSAATPDQNNKYGFFCYPRDNANGEFTDLPDTVDCTLTIYPYSS